MIPCSVAISVNARMLGDLFCLDLNTDENPRGEHSTAELYKYLLDVRVWGFNNNDPGLAWNRRRYAQEAAVILSKSTEKLLAKVRAEKLPRAFVDKLKSILPWQEADKSHVPKQGSLRWYGTYVVSELFEAGKTVKEVSDIMWLTALAGVGVNVALVRVVPRACIGARSD